MHSELVGDTLFDGNTQKAVNAQIRKALVDLQGDWTPFAFRYRQATLFVYRTQYGWCTKVTRLSQREPETFLGGYCISNATRDQAISEGLGHIAQHEWNLDLGTDPPSFLPTHEAGLYRSWTAFQTRYARARAAGYSDCDSHDYARANPSKQELVARIDAKLALAA